jgi:hypothetical protein
MHRLPYHENQHAPCNLYCHGEVHVDVLYLAPWAIAQAGADLLGYVRAAWQRHGLCRKFAFLRPNLKIGCQKINSLRD